MNISNIAKGLVLFFLGVVLGVMGAITLRHEIWPLANRVGILAYYTIAAAIIFLFFIVWYFQILRSLKKTLNEQLFSAIIKLFNFLIAFIFIVIIIGGGIIFIAVG